MKRYDLGSLLELIKERPAREVVQRGEWEGPERPGDEFNRMHSEREVLEWLGFHSPSLDYQGEHWVRPGKDPGSGASATIYAGEDPHVTIWSETCLQMWPALEARRPYDAYGLFVATFFGGDHSKASQHLAEDGYGEPREAPETNLIEELEAYLSASTRQEAGSDEITGWEPVDLVAAMRAGPPPPPDLLRRSDDVPLLYRKKINFFYGPPESCKSWAAKAALCSAFREGKKSIYIDFENDPFSFGEHIQAMGITDEVAIRERIVYLNPDRPYSLKAIAQLTEVLKAGAELVVVDGVSNAFGLLGKDPMNHNDIVSFELSFLRPLTVSGGAVLAIDHSPKNSENATLFGGQHKKAAITGASYFFSIRDPFGRGMHGVAMMKLDKDKPGYLRKYVEYGNIAELHLFSDVNGAVSFQLQPPGMPLDFRPTSLMETFSRYVIAHPGCDERSILGSTSSEKEDYKRLALKILISEGYVANDLGGLYRPVRPYLENPDLIAQMEASDLAGTLPPSVRRIAAELEAAAEDDLDEETPLTVVLSPAPMDRFFQPAGSSFSAQEDDL